MLAVGGEPWFCSGGPPGPGGGAKEAGPQGLRRQRCALALGSGSCPLEMVRVRREEADSVKKLLERRQETPEGGITEARGQEHFSEAPVPNANFCIGCIGVNKTDRGFKRCWLM